MEMDKSICSFFQRCMSLRRLDEKQIGAIEWLDDSPPRYRSVSRASCLLLKYLWDKDWCKALKRIQTHPEETFCLTENSGRSALHLASFNHGCPAGVVEMLLSSNRHALWIKDKSGYTPLHYACTFKGGTDHLIQIFCGHLKLLNSQYNGPPSILFSIKSPLYLACNRNAPLHVISTLVSTAHDDLCCKWIAPETGGEPYWFRKNDLNTQVEFSPLEALLQHYDVNDALSLDRRLLREVFKTNALMHAQHNDQDTDLNNDFEMMRKVLILIEAGFRGYSGSMLHLVSSLRTPIPSLIEVAGTLLPEQALLRDSLGCIPLHHVLLHSCTSLAMIMAVLEIDSRACSIPTPDDCSYPLMLAIKQGLSWDNGVKELVARMPEVLEVADSGGLVPCMLAASMNADVTTIFELLRASPQLCAYLI